jgi:hypothetical protein
MSVVTTEQSQWCKTTETGIEVLRQPTAQEWAAFGSQLSQINRSLMWVVGDWLLMGEAEGYLDRGKLNEACEQFGIAYGTARHAVTVCRAHKSAMRMALLTFSHHQLVTNRDDASELLAWAAKNKATVAALRAEKKRRDSGDVVPAASPARDVPDDQLTPDAKLFRDFLKCVDGKPRMTLADITREMNVSLPVAAKLVFAATVHPAVDVVTKGRGTGTAFVVDWKEQSASDRIDKLHNKPELKRLDDQLEQVIDSALSLIDGFYHAHRSSFQRIRPKDHRRLMTRSEVLRQRAAEFADDIQTRVPGD